MNEPIDPNAQSAASGDQGATQASPTPPVPPADQSTGGGTTAKNDLSGIMDDDVDVGNLVANAGQNQDDSQVLLTIPIPPHPNTNFDEKIFVQLLAGSISLTINEKKKIVDAIPKLSQFQIDELMKIFDEEKNKFAELEKKHSEQISELEKQHAGSPQDLEDKQQEEEKRGKEAQEAEDIKKQLGL